MAVVYRIDDMHYLIIEEFGQRIHHFVQTTDRFDTFVRIFIGMERGEIRGSEKLNRELRAPAWR